MLSRYKYKTAMISGSSITLNGYIIPKIVYIAAVADPLQQTHEVNRSNASFSQNHLLEISETQDVR